MTSRKKKLATSKVKKVNHAGRKHSSANVCWKFALHGMFHDDVPYPVRVHHLVTQQAHELQLPRGIERTEGVAIPSLEHNEGLLVGVELQKT